MFNIFAKYEAKCVFTPFTTCKNPSQANILHNKTKSSQQEAQEEGEVMSDGYDPQKSRVAEDTLADFLRAPLTGDLTEVPGIGPAAVTKLGAGEDGDVIENTFQLIGKFLMLKVREACDVSATARGSYVQIVLLCRRLTRLHCFVAMRCVFACESESRRTRTRVRTG